MPFPITKNSQLNNIELENLKQLAKICQENDGDIPQMHWDIIIQKRAQPSNFFCYENETLIGYLSFFHFDENQVDICAIVHPHYRRRRIFLNLFQAASENIRNLDIHKTIFSFPQKNQMAKDCIKSLGGKFIHSEYHMQREGITPEIIANNTLILKMADIHDIALMAQIDDDCFRSDYSIMLRRFQETITHTNRKVWLSYLKDTCIGKIHVLFDNTTPVTEIYTSLLVTDVPWEHTALLAPRQNLSDRGSNGAYIHNVCILPTYQKNGYGTILLQSVINELISTGSTQIDLDVTASQESALNLYKKCHFKIKNTYEYWEYYIIPTARISNTLAK